MPRISAWRSGSRARTTAVPTIPIDTIAIACKTSFTTPRPRRSRRLDPVVDVAAPVAQAPDPAAAHDHVVADRAGQERHDRGQKRLVADQREGLAHPDRPPT